MQAPLTRHLLILALALGMGSVAAEGTNDGADDSADVRKPDERQSDRPRRETDRQRAFRDADENKDGYLSLEEFGKMKRLARLDPEKRKRIFTFLDKNKDGKLQHQELHPHRGNRFGPLLKNFAQLDADDSGGLSLEEFGKSPVFKNAQPERLARLFHKLDKNKNGQIEKSELLRTGRHGKPVMHFEQYDKDKSGGLSFEEYSSIPFMERVSEDRRREIFDRIDTNNDQQLTADEIKRASRRHRHDGRGRGPRSPERGTPRGKPGSPSQDDSSS